MKPVANLVTYSVRFVCSNVHAPFDLLLQVENLGVGLTNFKRFGYLMVTGGKGFFTVTA